MPKHLTPTILVSNYAGDQLFINTVNNFSLKRGDFTPTELRLIADAFEQTPSPSTTARTDRGDLPPQTNSL